MEKNKKNNLRGKMKKQSKFKRAFVTTGKGILQMGGAGVSALKNYNNSYEERLDRDIKKEEVRYRLRKKQEYLKNLKEKNRKKDNPFDYGF